MIFRLLMTGAILAGSLSAGVLKLPDGTEVEGTFSSPETGGLQLLTADGTLHKVTPGTFKSLTVDAGDTLWPPELRAAGSNEFGLLGQYFEGTEFKGKPRVRIDPDITFRWGGDGPFADWRKDGFSARWTGHFQVPESGEYEFITWSDDGVRLFINDRQLIANWSDHSITENKTSISLDAADLHEIRIEYFENSGDAELRIEWSGRDRQRHPLGDLILITDGAGVTETGASRPTEVGLHPGLVLRDGTVLHTQIRRANDTAFELAEPFAGRTISTFNVARVVFREIPASLAAATRPGRQGALLVGGDFVDSEFQSLDSGILQVSSLLFGLQRLDTKYETHALCLRDPAPAAARWRVRDRAGSVILSETLAFSGNSIVVSNAVLHALTLPLDTLVTIEAAGAAELFPASLRFGPDSEHATAHQKPRTDDSERRRIDSLKRMAEQEKNRREREMSDTARKAREELAQLEEARRKRDETAKKHAEAVKDRDRLLAEREEQQKAHDGLTTQRDRLDAMLNELNREYSRRRAAIVEIEGRQKRENAQAKNLEKALKKKGGRSDETEQSRLEKEMAAIRTRQRELLDEHVKAVRESEAARKQREETDRRLAAVKRDLGGRKTPLDRARRAVDSAERQLNQLAGMLKQYCEKFAAAEAKVQARERAELR